VSWFYENLEVRPCSILGFLHFEVVAGNVCVAAFRYEDDAILFKDYRKSLEKKEMDDNKRELEKE